MPSSDSDSDHEHRNEKTGVVPSVPPPPYAPGTSAYPPPGFQHPHVPPPTQSVYPPGIVHQTGYYTTNNAGQQVYVSQVTKVNRSTYDDLRGAIPIMPMPLAITCCVLNFFLPGIGTITASFCVFCCANIGQSAGGKMGCFCLNFWIGWLQLFTVWLFLFGWIWSIMWGWAFVAASAEYYSSRTQAGVTTTVITETPVTYAHRP
ncbi:protein stum homolog [Styela clava]